LQRVGFIMFAGFTAFQMGHKGGYFAHADIPY
jgi:hypothetical protein